MKTCYGFVLWLLAFLALSGTATAQYNWLELSAPAAGSRYDDMAWRSPELGYVIDFNGPLRKTTDGGNTWQQLQGPVGRYYRSVGFLTDQKGFIGKLQPSLTTPSDTFTLYRTLDGGQNWAAVPIPTVPSAIQGFCGMSVVNENVMYGCGRFSGPAYVYKTTDGGNTWTTINMAPHAAGLIDCYFWSPDSGIVVGHNGIPWDVGNSIILFTPDGGQTWQNRYTSPRSNELCWKISFPSENVGYVSINGAGPDSLYILKTTDKGQTWQDILLSPTPYYAEGIGFLNDSVGWVGGGLSNMIYFTTNSGQSWTMQPLGSFINRFRIFGDSLAYASGKKVHKLDLRVLATPGQLFQALNPDVLSAPFPNPATTYTNATIDLATGGRARLVLLDALGREVKELYYQPRQPEGKQQLHLPLYGLAPGNYLLQLQTTYGVQSQKLVIHK